jgi:GNAT superfamily N-acetyltransferase
VRSLDLADADQARDFLALLDHYARDPMGGGAGLSGFARAHLVPELARVPAFHGALAWLDGEAVGLVNTFLGFSTFAARPLLNIHDIVVRADCRGRGVGRALLAWSEQRARSLGCCKLTLEVLSNNRRAMHVYAAAGYAPYQLDPAAGQALLLQKSILV